MSRDGSLPAPTRHHQLWSRSRTADGRWRGLRRVQRHQIVFDGHRRHIRAGHRVHEEDRKYRRSGPQRCTTTTPNRDVIGMGPWDPAWTCSTGSSSTTSKPRHQSPSFRQGKTGARLGGLPTGHPTGSGVDPVPQWARALRRRNRLIVGLRISPPTTEDRLTATGDQDHLVEAAPPVKVSCDPDPRQSVPPKSIEEQSRRKRLTNASRWLANCYPMPSLRWRGATLNDESNRSPASSPERRKLGSDSADAKPTSWPHSPRRDPSATIHRRRVGRTGHCNRMTFIPSIPTKANYQAIRRRPIRPDSAQSSWIHPITTRHSPPEPLANMPTQTEWERRHRRAHPDMNDAMNIQRTTDRRQIEVPAWL